MVDIYLFLICFFILGLIVGSFLNVVIYRLPLMLECYWKNQARLLLDLPVAEDQKKFNLFFPKSHCSHCHTKLKLYENIPVVSYVLQVGRCRYCHHKISLQYLIVELITGVIFTLLYYRFGLSYALLGGVVFSSALIALTFIDFRTKLLPDIITIPLLWLGLLFNLFKVYEVSLEFAVLGALVGYLLFWIVFQIFKFLTAKEGVGYGDFKLFAAIGAWLGIVNLPFLLLFASISGLIFALVFKIGKNQEMPFGPAIAISGLILFIFYPEISSWLSINLRY
ncbi:MAG: prepilin peptidase [Neisseriaceae bacterium]|nr:MAG: prepilin peptidase [Neisseriaceae bacterium]